jgi:hypothetical protein
MTDAGIKVLDGTAYERDGAGFAGTIIRDLWEDSAAAC